MRRVRVMNHHTEITSCTGWLLRKIAGSATAEPVPARKVIPLAPCLDQTATGAVSGSLGLYTRCAPRAAPTHS
jgi:hypothetical protein